MNKIVNQVLVVGLIVLAAACVGGAAQEQDLIAVLQSNAGAVEKCSACQQLRICGTAQSIPALAAVLGDERVGHAARYALEGMPYPEASAALRNALDKTSGATKAGVIDSIGRRRDEAAAPLLAAMLKDKDVTVAKAAASALGRIGTPAAAKALEQALAAAKTDRDAVADAYLACADGLLAGGDRQSAGAMYERVLGSDLPGSIQGIALQGYARAFAPAKAATEVVSALQRGDEQLQSTAAQVARSMQDAQATRLLVEALPDLPTRAQVWLIFAMAGRRDSSVAAAVTRACESKNAEVRLAAVETLGSVGDVASIPVLLKAAAVDEADAGCRAALVSLSSLPGDDVDKALLARLDRANEREKQAILAVLIRREAADAVPVLLKTARNPQCRAISISGLQALANAEHVPAMVDLMECDEFLTSSNAQQLTQVRRMLVGVAERCRAQTQVSKILTARLETAKDAGVRETILLTLGELGDEVGLPVLRKTLNEGQGAIRWAAVAAMSRWPNAQPLPDLLRVAGDKSDRVSQARALRAYIGLAGTAAAMQPSERLECYKTALGMTPDATAKRMIFAGLQRVETLESMQLAASRVQDEDAREEAALAAVTIAEAIYASSAKEVGAALEKIVAANVANTTKERAQKTLDEVKAVRSYVTDWEVAGPYEEKDKNHSQLFDIAFAPEKPDAQVAWRKMAVSKYEQHPAYADLLKELDGGEQKVAYLRTQIESDSSKAVTLEIFSDDGVKAWLNGQVVHSNNTARPILADPDRVNVTLNQGVNALVLKVTQNNLPWGAIVRIKETKPVEAKVGDGWRLRVINADSRFEAAGILDVNKDGKLDILSGGFWYEAPNWTKHFVREIKEEGNYFYDFANLPMDVDGDGWMDTAGAAWHNSMVYWVRNPGKTDEPWQVFEVDTPGNMETAMAYDIDGDGRLDILPNIMSQAAWYGFTKDASAPQGVKWQKHPLPQEAAGHGLGAGDVNGDGRCDVVSPKGWLEQMADGSWQWRPEFDLGYSSIPILVHDADGDGDADLLWGLGHNYGVYWMEQKTVNGQRAWEKYLIDDSWSQPHFLLTADLDNDGADELVTGKRYHAHNGHDPGGNDARCVYYYDLDRATKKWTRHVLHEGGAVGFGINTFAADIDGDGDVDVVAPGKSGLFLLENTLK